MNDNWRSDWRGWYPPQITAFLAGKGSEGASTEEIIAAIRAWLDTAQPPGDPVPLDPAGTGWGVRAALVRMWKHGDLAKRFEFFEWAPPVGSPRNVRNQPVRRMRWWLRDFAPGTDSTHAFAWKRQP